MGLMIVPKLRKLLVFSKVQYYLSDVKIIWPKIKENVGCPKVIIFFQKNFWMKIKLFSTMSMMEGTILYEHTTPKGEILMKLRIHLSNQSWMEQFVYKSLFLMENSVNTNSLLT